MKDKDLLLISHLRKDARTPMTTISKNTRIPVSTIFDKLKTYKGNVIDKHTCLLNFKELGYEVKAHLLFKVQKEQREEFLKYIRTHGSTNNIFRVNNGYDYLVEAVFRNLHELQEFYEETENRGVEDKQEHFVLEDVAREQFLNHKPGFEIMNGFRNA